MIVSEMRLHIWRDLNEAGLSQNDRITAEDLLGYLNMAHERLAAETQCYSRTAEIVVTEDTAVYALPADMFMIRSVTCAPALAELTRVTMRQLSAKSPSWRNAASGTPSQMYLKDSRAFGVYPPPDDVAIGPLSVEGCIVPYDIPAGDGGVVPAAEEGAVGILALDSDAPEFPVAYHMALVHYAVAQICAKFLANNEAAAAKAGTAMAEYAAIRDKMADIYTEGVMRAAPVV